MRYAPYFLVFTTSTVMLNIITSVTDTTANVTSHLPLNVHSSSSLPPPVLRIGLNHRYFEKVKISFASSSLFPLWYRDGFITSEFEQPRVLVITCFLCWGWISSEQKSRICLSLHQSGGPGGVGRASQSSVQPPVKTSTERQPLVSTLPLSRMGRKCRNFLTSPLEGVSLTFPWVMSN